MHPLLRAPRRAAPVAVVITLMLRTLAIPGASVQLAAVVVTAVAGVVGGMDTETRRAVLHSRQSKPSLGSLHGLTSPSHHITPRRSAST